MSGAVTRPLEIEDAAIVLGGRRVLHDVRLEVGRGEFVGLIGPNGAGKTTLLRAILGLVPLAAGTIRVDGSANAHHVRGKIGYVPQRHDFAWDFPISVEETVLSGLVRQIGWFRGARVRDYLAVAEALDRVEMTHLSKRPIGELSGGQRQRVLVARALVLGSPLLLLDEPFTGLDMPTQELLIELFQRLAAEGIAVFMTTHDLIGALAECSRLCLLNRTLIADAPPDELRDVPEVWIDTFKIKPTNPLLTTLGMV